jgi:hypothetical protein
MKKGNQQKKALIKFLALIKKLDKEKILIALNIGIKKKKTIYKKSKKHSEQSLYKK